MADGTAFGSNVGGESSDTVLQNSSVGGFSAGNVCPVRQAHRPMAYRREGSYPAPRIKGVFTASDAARLS